MLSAKSATSEAFEGVERAFFLSPAGYADQYKNLSPLIQEAKRRGLKKEVLMTAVTKLRARSPRHRPIAGKHARDITSHQLNRE